MNSYFSKLKIVLFLLISCSFFSQKLPTSNEIISEYYKALGGLAKLEQVKYLKMQTILTVDSKSYAGTEVWIAPNIFKKTQKLGHEEVIQFFDGKFGYVSQGDHREAMSEPVVQKLQKRKLIAALEFDANEFNKVEEAKSGQQQFYVLVKSDSKIYFDKQTSLLSKIETSEGNQNFWDYKSFDGILLPTKIITTGQNKTSELTYQNILVNREVTYDDLQ
ncbi:hypothetical protein [Soonwooa sp.]|uniref:hypothetical protein n=1 Tax=Soonwooa sp. TaxID=1938592 RepID=UPI00289FEB11|nr:hypothetical protein [Soonwooa sp.]